MITWSSPEFHYHEKDEAWPVIVVLAGIAIAGIALWQHNFLFFVFTLIATGLAVIWGTRQPRHFEFSLEKRGVRIDGKIHAYHDFDGFAIDSGILQLSTRSVLKPRFSILIPDERAGDIHGHLLAFLPEIEYDESFIEALGRIARF